MNLKNTFIFIIGVSVSSAITYKVVKDIYERRLQEEIESVKEVFGRRRNEVDKPEVDKPEEKVKKYNNISTNINDYNEKKEYNNKISYYNYAQQNDDVTEVEEEKNIEFHEIESPDSDIYIIHPQEFGALDDYDLITLIYYADGVLTDDMNKKVYDIDNTVVKGFETHFGEFENDCVYIRNNKHHADYEILRDNQRYSDSEMYRNLPPHYQ